MGLGGAPTYLGAVPDLAAIGKAVGGGLPLAAVGGGADADLARDLKDHAGDRRIFQSGTFTENPLSVAAGLAVLDVIESEPVLQKVPLTVPARRSATVWQACLPQPASALPSAGAGRSSRFIWAPSGLVTDVT